MEILNYVKQNFNENTFQNELKAILRKTEWANRDESRN